jgi:hypothetical protein
MNRLRKLLTLLLAVQLLLVAIVFWPRSDQAEISASSSLLALNSEAVQRIIISDSQSDVVLARTDAGWVMPEYHGLPTDPARLQRVLEELPALERGWPLASTAAAKNRFEVAEDNFQRAVNYIADEQSLGKILLGTSPGFRKVHTRPVDSDDVFAVTFSSFELPVVAAQWLDKNLLQVAELNAVRGLDYQIRRQDQGWSSDNGTAPVQAEVDKLINGLSNLRVTAAADIAMAAELQQMAVPPTLIVETTRGTLEYRLYQVDAERYIQRNDIPVFFSLSDLDFDRLNQVNAASLYPAEAPTDAAAPAG